MSQPLDRARLEAAHQELRWRAYRDDPELFFQECVWVPSQRDPRGRERFELFDYQVEDLHTLVSNKFVIGLKARQIGWSTLIAGLLLHRSIFREGSVCLWVSNTQDNANKAVAMLSVMWNFLPGWVRERAPRLTGDQAGKKEWTFASGMTSRIRAFAGTATAAASETASIVVLDEFGLVDAHIQDDLFRSSEPTTDAGGQLWILSTARGAYNRFATMFKDAAAGLSRFVAIFRPWMVSRFVNRNATAMRDCPYCEGRGMEGDEPCRCVDRSVYIGKAGEFKTKPWLLHAEYPMTPEEAFRESGNPRFTGLPREDECFDGWVRGRMAEGALGQPVFRPDENGPVRMREDLVDDEPAESREYVMFVDPSKGIGQDYMAAHVLSMDAYGPAIFAFFHANIIEPVEAARQFDLLGRYFGGLHPAAELAVESTGGYGDSIITELQVHRHYPRLYRHTIVGSTRRRPQQRIGFPMSVQKRPLVVDRLADYLQDDEKVIGYIHPMLRQELSTFVTTEDGRMQADVGCHDDLVMSLGGALWILVEKWRATNPPSVEEDTGDPVPRLTLKTMFERIEKTRRAANEKDRREMDRIERRVQRSMKRSGRSRSGAR